MSLKEREIIFLNYVYIWFRRVFFGLNVTNTKLTHKKAIAAHCTIFFQEKCFSVWIFIKKHLFFPFSIQKYKICKKL